jgi:hypothetical protein
MRRILLLSILSITACPRAPANTPASEPKAKASKPAEAPSPPEPKKAPPPPPGGPKLAKISTAPRVKRTPSNERSPLGTNLVSPNFMTTQWAFLDSMKSADWWTSCTVDKWGDGRRIDLDELGWPRALESGQRATTIIPAQEGGPMVLRYDGKGAIELSGTEGPVADVDERRGRITFVAKRDQQLILAITETDPNDHIRNIQVYAKKHEKLVTAGAIFNPTFLDRLAPFKVVRFMDWQRTNSSPIVEWAGRTEPRFYTQAHATGIAYEYLVLLANTLKFDPWFCLPHKADDAFVAKFAAFVRDELDPSLKTYVEYSNEVWHDHPEFNQALYARKQGEALGLHRDNGIARLMYQAQRSSEMMAIVARIIPKERLVRVLGSQLGNHYAHDALLKHAGTKEHTDALAVAAYFGHEVGSNHRLLAKKDPKAVLDFLEKRAVPWTLDAISKSTAWGKKNGVAIIAYEGGQHLVAEPAQQGDADVARVLDTANAHERMGRAYTRLLEGWKAAGGGVFVHFTFAARPGRFGRFGMLDALDQPRKEAPKYDAIMTFIEKTPPWWD